jgi:peptidoglycan/xylan/chitin deacetylase (PgdA/CDA1 family)
MLRPLAKTMLASSLRWSSADAWVGALSGARRLPLIIGYHRVVEDFRPRAGHEMPGMVVSRGMLERHLDWIGKRFDFVSLNELGARLEASHSVSRSMAAVTFDDGYADVYANAFPLLTRKGIPAAVFAVTDLVGTGRPLLHDTLYFLLARLFARAKAPQQVLLALLRSLALPLPGKACHSFSRGLFPAFRILNERLPQSDLRLIASALEGDLGQVSCELAELRPLAWDELARMSAMGFTVGSHGKTHARLTLESAAGKGNELARSRAELERHLGVSVHHFAYPDGDFDHAAVAAVAAAGYHFAYTICTHREPQHPLLTIPRRMLWEGSCVDSSGRYSDAVMSCQVNGIFDLVSGCSRNHALAV